MVLKYPVTIADVIAEVGQAPEPPAVGQLTKNEEVCILMIKRRIQEEREDNEYS